MVIVKTWVVKYQFATYPLYLTVDGKYYLPGAIAGQLYEIAKEEAEGLIEE